MVLGERGVLYRGVKLHIEAVTDPPQNLDQVSSVVSTDIPRLRYYSPR